LEYSGRSTTPIYPSDGHFTITPNSWSGANTILISNDPLAGVPPHSLLTGYTVPFTLHFVSITNPDNFLIFEVTAVNALAGGDFTINGSVISYGTEPAIDERFCINASQNGKDANCQLQYKWSAQGLSYLVPSQTLMTATGSFTASTVFSNFLGLSYTGYPGNNYTNYLSGITSAYFLITKTNDPDYYMGFQGNLYTQIATQTIFKIVDNTYSSSALGAGTPTNNDILCVTIHPLSTVNTTGTTVCSNISAITINFTSVTTGDTLTFTLPPGLGIQAGDDIKIIYTPNPNVQVLGTVISYDPDGASPNIQVLVELVLNDGYTAGLVNQSLTCYELITNQAEFIFQKTLFVDPNGDDVVASDVTPYGGILNPPFQTIQAAVDYIEDHYTIGDLTIHVFAGLYDVSATDPIRVGFTGGTASLVNVNLYMEDGVIIKDNSSTASTDPNNPDYLFIMAGSRPTISGYGTISATAGPAGFLHYVNVIRLNHGEIARIQVERIDANFRYNVGYVFYYPVGSDKLTSTIFEGEVKINDLNHGLLRMSGGTEQKLFEFKHDTNITILRNQNNVGYEPVVLSGQSVAIVRGDWYYAPYDSTDDRSIFNFGSTGSTYVFDGADIYVTSGSSNNYIINTNSLNNCRIEVRERSITNGYINPADTIINYSFGVLEQGVPITPNKL